MELNRNNIFYFVFWYLSWFVVEIKCDITALSKERIGIYRSATHKLNSALDGISAQNVDARAEIILAKALGAGIEQDLENAASLAKSLVDEGSTTAHTTLGLLFMHNLTGRELEEHDRKQQSISHYMVAALKGDALAQVIVGEHYSDKNDCESALSYYRKGAQAAVSGVSEGTTARPGMVNYLWPEDNPFGSMGLPSFDELHYLEHLAHHGDGDAALKVAYLTYSSLIPELEKDIQKVVTYLKLASENNATSAMVFLANMILSGEVDGDDGEALELLQTALKLGDLSANAGLGRMYMEGRANLTQNYTKAELYLKKGYESGNMGAFYQTGILYDILKRPFDDIEQAWILGAVNGHVHSAWKLAEHFRKRHQQATSTSITKQGDSDHFCKLSLPFYRLVALNGEWFNLFQGAYKDFNNKKFAAALLKYLLLSDLGYPAAHVNAARILENFPTDVYEGSSSCQVALEMWRRTAKDGVATGFLKIGDYHYNGIGVELDMQLALNNYRRSAFLNNGEALFNEAWMYEHGQGVPQNIRLAEKKYTTLLEKHEEALAPATIALGKLKLFRFVNDTLGWNLYSFKYKDVTSGFQVIANQLILFLTGYWDLLTMLALVISIAICYNRRL